MCTVDKTAKELMSRSRSGAGSGSGSGGADYQVYLDKFVSFPHLPIDPSCKEPPSRRKYQVIPPNIAHTGITTKFNPPTERSVYPTGALTSEYIGNAFWQGRQTARAVMKNELAKIRPANEKSVKMESQLVEIEERRQKYQSLCEKQLESEFHILNSTQKTQQKKKKKGQTTKPLTPLKKIRPKRIYNRESLISCILDTTDMSVCSQDSLTNFETLESSNRFQNQSQSQEKDDSLSQATPGSLKSRLINTEKWDQEALRLAYPEVEDDGDSISLAIEGLYESSKYSSERRGGS
jgi:hypothetical protein